MATLLCIGGSQIDLLYQLPKALHDWRRNSRYIGNLVDVVISDISALWVYLLHIPVVGPRVATLRLLREIAPRDLFPDCRIQVKSKVANIVGSTCLNSRAVRNLNVGI